MILKFIKHPEPNFKKALKYIDHEKNGIPPITHNLNSSDKKGILKEFYDNDKFRKKRKDGVGLIHVIGSMSVKDYAHCSVQKVEDLIYKKLELWADNAISITQIHKDKDHWHWHSIVSANEIRSSKSMNQKNKEFKTLKKKLELYQIKTYPELVNSVVHHSQKELERLNYPYVKRNSAPRVISYFWGKSDIGKQHKIY